MSPVKRCMRDDVKMQRRVEGMEEIDMPVHACRKEG